jgi:hypothetical protein
LLRILVRVTCEVNRHAGQADIMREQHDDTVGLLPRDANVPAAYDWPAYVAKLTELADRFA